MVVRVNQSANAWAGQSVLPLSILHIHHANSSFAAFIPASLSPTFHFFVFQNLNHILPSGLRLLPSDNHDMLNLEITLELSKAHSLVL